MILYVRAMATENVALEADSGCPCYFRGVFLMNTSLHLMMFNNVLARITFNPSNLIVSKPEARIAQPLPILVLRNRIYRLTQTLTAAPIR